MTSARKAIRLSDEESEAIVEELIDWFSVVPDPRREQGKRHELAMMILMTLCAVLCGADNWPSVVTFCESQKSWLREFRRMPYGVPCVSTFEYVFSMLEPKAFAKAMQDLARHLVRGQRRDEHVAIDGKRLRRSFGDAAKQGGLHLLHAFGVQTGLLLGQEATDSKENEIVAMPRLLRMLDIRGQTVTVDAMLTQKSIAEQIKTQGGDYIMALKDNHPTVHALVQKHFEFAERMNFQSTRMGESFGHHSPGEKVDKEHGRVEVRKVDVLDARGEWFHREHSDWGSVQSVVRVQSERTVGLEKTSYEERYFLCSHPADKHELIARCIRNHWSVESAPQAHRVKEVQYEPMKRCA